jgi:ABC-2 type transport system permease protein
VAVTSQIIAQRSAAPTRSVGGVRKFLVDLKYLFLEQMLEIRATWYWLLIFSLVLPLAMVFGFARIGGMTPDRARLLYVISGSAIFAATNDGLYGLAVRIGSMKQSGQLIYYMSLPISKVAFVIAVVLARLILTMPGMVAPILFGAWLYGIHFDLNLWIVAVLPLTALTMSAVGMALGSLIEELELVQIIVNLLLFVLVTMAPVFTPIEALPVPLQILGYCLPPTYAADAMRHILNGEINAAFYADLVILAGMAGISFIILSRWLRWRLR